MKFSLTPLTIALQLAALASAAPCTENPSDEFLFRIDNNNDPVIQNCQWLQGRDQPLNVCKRKKSAEKDGIIYLPPGEVCRVTCETCPPTEEPSGSPTMPPSLMPSPFPTMRPTSTPSDTPTDTPSTTPTIAPSPVPSPFPTLEPTSTPSETPTDTPSTTPTAVPTFTPTPCTESPTDEFLFRVTNDGDLVIQDCAWLRGKENPLNVCKRKKSAEKDGITYLPPGQVCKETCETCPTEEPSATPSVSPTAIPTASTTPTAAPSSPPTYCIDSPSFIYWGKQFRLCGDLSEKDCNFEKVYTHCPLQCGKCDDGDLVCADSTATFKDGKKKRTCAFVRKLRAKGKKRQCGRPRMLYTCRDTCEFCPDTDAPSANPTIAPTTSAYPSSYPSKAPKKTSSPTKTPKRRALYYTNRNH